MSELAAVGVRRVSVGGAFAFAALGATVEAAQELLDEGTYGYFGSAAGIGLQAPAHARPLGAARAVPQPWIFSPRSSMAMNFCSRRSRVSGFFASCRR